MLCDIALARVVAPLTGYIDTTLPKQREIIKTSSAARIHAKNAQLPAFLAVNWALKSQPDPTIEVAPINMALNNDIFFIDTLLLIFFPYIELKTL
ncbi:hypothetical protein fh0823_10360 [Francisella halioticida]|nr:hypothetical protein fh0823_10360 [Francisella halioticida]